MDILPLFIRTALIYVVVFVLMRLMEKREIGKISPEAPTIASFEPVRYEGLPLPLIMDGKVQDENLEKLGKTRFWLKNQIQQKGVREFKEVFFCSVDHNGRLFLDRNR